VAPGKALAADVMKLSSAKTVHGQKVTITSDNGIKVNGARVIKTDIAFDNGVIHVIDTVLTLSTVTPTPNSPSDVGRQTIPESPITSMEFMSLLNSSESRMDDLL
jgi:hypothetical protein